MGDVIVFFSFTALYLFTVVFCVLRSIQPLFIIFVVLSGRLHTSVTPIIQGLRAIPACHAILEFRVSLCIPPDTPQSCDSNIQSPSFGKLAVPLRWYQIRTSRSLAPMGDATNDGQHSDVGPPVLIIGSGEYILPNLGNQVAQALPN